MAERVIPLVDQRLAALAAKVPARAVPPTGLLTDTVAALPSPDGCTCSTWADGLSLTYEIP